MSDTCEAVGTLIDKETDLEERVSLRLQAKQKSHTNIKKPPIMQETLRQIIESERNNVKGDTASRRSRVEYRIDVADE